MRKLSFEDAITWAVFVISLVLVAAPFITGEETIGSLLKNRLALIGAVTLVLLFIYKLPSLLKEKPKAEQPEDAKPAVEKLPPPTPIIVPTPTGTAPADTTAKPANQAQDLRKTG